MASSKDRDQIMNDYYKNVTDEQLGKDMKEAFAIPEGTEVTIKLPNGEAVQARTISMNKYYSSED